VGQVLIDVSKVEPTLAGDQLDRCGRDPDLEERGDQLRHQDRPEREAAAVVPAQDPERSEPRDPLLGDVRLDRDLPSGVIPRGGILATEGWVFSDGAKGGRWTQVLVRMASVHNEKRHRRSA
jgi:hypothetical protein